VLVFTSYSNILTEILIVYFNNDLFSHPITGTYMPQPRHKKLA